jgi:hypothetical protein
MPLVTITLLAPKLATATGSEKVTVKGMGAAAYTVLPDAPAVLLIVAVGAVVSIVKVVAEPGPEAGLVPVVAVAYTT